MVRTRFAPSPTGFLHIGGVRTALYAWAFARRHQGQFILRIEDTDIERSTDHAVQVIIDSLQWLDLDYDEGPFYQTKRMARYQEVAQILLEKDAAYHCYMQPEELDALRQKQRNAGKNPRYDGRWRPEHREKKGLTIPPHVQPVIRFRNPDEGFVQWHDLIKGPISIGNDQLDDFVIMRADGTPTYNFCVVVDDWDMAISHVIRGDDHVNNTPKQINLFRALGVSEPPQYAHLSTICSTDGQKLSKRQGAISVLQYRDQGYRPEALINYLARLGWSHGDAEVFTREQFVSWFDLKNVSGVSAQFNPEKLIWLNKHYLHHGDDAILAQQVMHFLPSHVAFEAASIQKIIHINKNRAKTLIDLAQSIIPYDTPLPLSPDDRAFLAEKQTQAIIASLFQSLSETPWHKDTIKQCIKQIAKERETDIATIATPLRLCLLGTRQSASFDLVLETLGPALSLKRLGNFLIKTQT